MCAIETEFVFLGTVLCPALLRRTDYSTIEEQVTAVCITYVGCYVHSAVSLRTYVWMESQIFLLSDTIFVTRFYTKRGVARNEALEAELTVQIEPMHKCKIHLCMGSKSFCNVSFVMQSLRMATCVAKTCSRYTVLVIYFYTHTCVCWIFF